MSIDRSTFKGGGQASLLWTRQISHVRGFFPHDYVLQFLFEYFEKLLRKPDALGSIPDLLEDIAYRDDRV